MRKENLKLIDFENFEAIFLPRNEVDGKIRLCQSKDDTEQEPGAADVRF